MLVVHRHGPSKPLLTDYRHASTPTCAPRSRPSSARGRAGWHPSLTTDTRFNTKTNLSITWRTSLTSQRSHEMSWDTSLSRSSAWPTLATSLRCCDGTTSTASSCSDSVPRCFPLPVTQCTVTSWRLSRLRCLLKQERSQPNLVTAWPPTQDR